MNKLGKILFMVLSVIGIFFIWKKSNDQGSVLKPDHCSVHLSKHWSQNFQQNLAQSIQEIYLENKNPENVISFITKKYGGIDSIQAHVCDAGTICFYVQQAQPVLLLNNLEVITSDGSVLPQENFEQSLCKNLPKIYTCTSPDIQAMVQFVQKTAPTVFQDYKVDWKNSSEIFLSSRGGLGITFLTNIFEPIRLENLTRSQELYANYMEKKSKRNNKKHQVLYDIRFKNQIIEKPGGQDGTCF